MLELLQRVVLDLADPLARDPERPADLLERPRLLPAQPVAHLDHLALAVRQRVERTLDVTSAERERCGVVRRLGALVLDEASVNLRRTDILRALDALPDRERKVIELRFGLLGEQPRTLEEVGRAFGVTRERIRQIENNTLKKLESLPEAQGLKDCV